MKNNKIARLSKSIVFLFLAFFHLSCLAAVPCQVNGGYMAMLLTQNNYAEVESTLLGCLKDYKGGLITAEELEKAFRMVPDALKNSPDTMFDAWVETYPKSYSARVSRAIFYANLAWKARGGKFSSETSKEQFNALEKYMMKAKRDIADSLALDDKPVLSYWEAIGVAKGIRTDTETTKGLRDQAIKIDPKVYGIRRAYLDYISPKWFGSTALMDEALAEAQASAMTEENKRHFHAGYLSTWADYLRIRDRAPEAISLYGEAYKIFPNVEFLDAAATLAQKADLHDKAIDIFTQMLAKNPKDAITIRRRGYEFEYFKKDHRMALSDYLAAADLGDAWAASRLGWWYMNGYNVSRDLAEAERYFKMAASKGNKSAITNLKYLEWLRNKNDNVTLQPGRSG